ncbi:MAG: DNA repair protein RecN [Anaerobiospirillum succiniciproducens]|uniref:DNA repair protein RecN n=1 Tax=Anaerobiospirillum succiniciproducens TaxID=13335 RepID=UPI002A760584|nr:DNA repair protein RecN [Anaerobiospirillum succiniciproducens]MDY2797623.1 DNA repair protein RecN [Anaerobiospirillum succiniciproducens]
MLEQLNLNNLALSVEAEVDFTPGMICITGETGAGKSLVVDALSLVLGAKADANMVRQGEKQLEVNARFSLKNQFKAIKLLDDYGFLQERNSKSSDQKIVSEQANTASVSQDLENHSTGDLISSHDPNLEQGESSEVDTAVVADGQAVGFDSWNMHDDDELLLRRIVTCEGKSKAYINGHPATLTQLREIGQLLVAVHGQHDGVRLMDGKRQLEIVDNFGKLRPLANEVNDAFNRYSKLRHDLTKLAEEQKAGAMTYKQDRYDLEELKRLDFAQGDYEELESMFDRAQHQAQFSYILGNLHAGIELNENSLVAILGKYLSSLDKVKAFDQRIDKIVENVDAAVQNLLEASGLAEDLCTHTLDVSITELEGRMTKAHELARRFSCLPKELYLMAERIENKINNFVSLRKRISDLTEEVKAARADYEAKAQELTNERKLASASLASKIEEKIKVLSLPDAKFDIELSRDEACKPRPSGRDELTFMFSANLGQGLRPLAAVASGGELSRLALAIEVLTASVNSTPTLIFDEIDTGISGRTALSVGELLNELGNYTQVITVTHLPQVAAKAHTQLVVAKYNEAGQVNSTITALNHDGRIEEISRMIGGSTITETTRQSARELLGFN